MGSTSNPRAVVGKGTPTVAAAAIAVALVLAVAGVACGADRPAVSLGGRRSVPPYPAWQTEGLGVNTRPKFAS